MRKGALFPKKPLKKPPITIVVKIIQKFDWLTSQKLPIINWTSA